MAVLSHWIEREIVECLKDNDGLGAPNIAINTDLTEDQVRRGVQWLLSKGVIRASSQPQTKTYPGEAGVKALKTGLPERRLLDMLKRGSPVQEIYRTMGREMGPAIGVCVKQGWIRMDGRQPVLVCMPDVILGEQILKEVESDPYQTNLDMSYFARRPGYIRQVNTEVGYSLTEEGKIAETTDVMDMDVDVADLYIARTHPLHDTISEVRETFVSLGFDEVIGDMTQSSFWNFDALFTPQDHPAREMQDTFYLDADEIRDASPHMESVAAAHQTGWGGNWDPQKAAKPVLRTHTTCVTIRCLAKDNPDDARLFSLGRVFRNEKPSYKHLAEFHQVEGVVVGEGVTLRDLMGMQREFYKRMGMHKVKFWPTYFPYTEPSLQSMVYNETLGKWVELFGMGMFRPEVTKPLGISRPVLAWGGGIERIAMMAHGVTDVRTFYNNDMGWLRGLPLCP